FDPVLASKSAPAQAMMGRYSEVFSHQIKNRIYFDPPPEAGGTFAGLVNVLKESPAAVLY
ncbi:MAG TPA: hypothetical protein VIL63_07490, partial [Terriglobales bacterium]